MSVQSHRFNIATDTGGDFVDTGAPFMGLVMQIHLDGSNLDTGCDIRLEGVASGVVVADYDNVGGQSWTRVPRILSYDTGGGFVGDQYPVLAHERLRLTVNQSDGAAGSQTATLNVVTGW